MAEPTVEECIDFFDTEMREGWTPSEDRFLNAFVGYLRDYARVEAMLDDPNVVRVPKSDWNKAVSWDKPVQRTFEENAIKQVAAWDKERTRGDD